MILKDDALYYQWVDYMTNNEIQKYKKQKNDINLYKSPAIQYTLDEKIKKNVIIIIIILHLMLLNGGLMKMKIFEANGYVK